MIKKFKIVGVMGSGKSLQSELAEPLGAALARLPVHLLTGGGYGVMQSVAKGFTEVEDRQGLSFGCIPSRPNKKLSDIFNAAVAFAPPSASYPNRYVEVPIYTPLDVYDRRNPDAITRNYINIMTSDVVIALPGGSGTRQEVELSQKFAKPVILYGPADQFADIATGVEQTEELAKVIDWVSGHIRTPAAAPTRIPELP